jgi:Na+-driven multidrug efflux pump
VLSPILALGITFLGPWVGFLLSSGSVELPLILCGLFGIAIAASALSRVIGMGALLALEADRPVAVSAMLGAAIGVPLLFALVPVLGATGAALALALSEVTVVLYQAVALRKRMKDA